MTPTPEHPLEKGVKKLAGKAEDRFKNLHPGVIALGLTLLGLVAERFFKKRAEESGLSLGEVVKRDLSNLAATAHDLLNKAEEGLHGVTDKVAGAVEQHQDALKKAEEADPLTRRSTPETPTVDTAPPALPEAPAQDVPENPESASPY